ncbi:MAG: hypothetical protein DHS20C18_41950 [Saprospiraceae bacterium]|nr:MAG: hypothetical protein DHS20C18_41950 [Saprospiraceae bacterium]
MPYTQLTLPENIAKVFIEAWNQRDAEKLASLFVADAEFVNVTGLWWHTRTDIFKAHDYGLKVIFQHSELKLVKTKVRYLADDIAIVHLKARLTNQTGLGEVKKTNQRNNILVFVVKKQGDFWQCHTTQNTEIIPNMETFVVSEDNQIQAVNYGEFKK